VALEKIVLQLQEQKARLQKELNAVVKMIRAAGKGVPAGVEEYGRSRKRGRVGRAIAKTKRTVSAAARKRMAAAQKARWARVKAEAKGATSSNRPTKRQVKANAAKQT
jgi:hypothetical protein